MGKMGWLMLKSTHIVLRSTAAAALKLLLRTPLNLSYNRVLRACSIPFDLGRCRPLELPDPYEHRQRHAYPAHARQKDEAVEERALRLSCLRRVQGQLLADDDGEDLEEISMCLNGGP